MGHEILGNRFIARSKPAWHNIAREIFDESTVIMASEAMAKVAGDIEFGRSPIWYEVDGEKIKAENRTAIYRKPTLDDPKFKVFGITSDAWVASTYPQLARALDGLSKQYKVETAGILSEGGLAFLCFRGDDYDVKRDEMRSYFTANFSLTPGVGHKVLKADVRTVCWNTNTQADARSTINLSIPHSTDALQRIELAARLVSQFKDMEAQSRGVFTAFADRHISSAEADTIFYAAFQLPALPPKLALLKNQLSETEAEVFKRALTADLLAGLEKAQESYDKSCQNILTLRKVAAERFEAFEPSHLRGTAWAAYNAVTEVSDWREGRGADEAALLGYRAKEKSRAFEAAYTLIGGK